MHKVCPYLPRTTLMLWQLTGVFAPRRCASSNMPTTVTVASSRFSRGSNYSSCMYVVQQQQQQCRVGGQRGIVACSNGGRGGGGGRGCCCRGLLAVRFEQGPRHYSPRPPRPPQLRRRLRPRPKPRPVRLVPRLVPAVHRRRGPGCGDEAAAAQALVPGPGRASPRRTPPQQQRERKPVWRCPQSALALPWSMSEGLYFAPTPL